MPTKMPSDVYWEFMFSSPFLGTFFQYGVALYKASVIIAFSSPFSGTFFQSDLYYCGYCDAQYMFSSPFLGTFFQCGEGPQESVRRIQLVFVPFLGDFLSITALWDILRQIPEVFVPFLGDFLSIRL